MPAAALIDDDVVTRVLTAALRTGGDFAEVFAEDKRSSSAYLDDGKIEELSSGRDRGAGIRVVVGETTGFAHTADLSETGLLVAAEAAAAAAREGGGGTRTVALTRTEVRHPSPAQIQPSDVAKATKVALLQRADGAARAAGGDIRQVSASYADSRRRILIANSDGLLTGDDQVRTLFTVGAVALGDTGMQTGRESIGHTIGFELFDRYDVEELARARRRAGAHQARGATGAHRRAARRHRAGRRWRAVPRGVRPRPRGRPRRQGRLGVQGPPRRAGRVAARHARRRRHRRHRVGRVRLDDEGTPAQRNVLIQDGILTDYMWDFLRSRKEGRPRSGNGRRQSYQHLPMVRMTNTFILDGPDDPASIVSGTEHGVYVAKLGGGQVNTATGDFVFGMTEAYLIENGEITEPLREGNLIGNGPEVLQNIEAVGNDFAIGPPGTCGKDGQGVPVGDGVPTLRVSKLTIGGSAA